MAEHTCHARNCDRAVPPEMLMCIRHWRMVPRDIARAVQAAYVPGQCDLDPMPSAAWHDAAAQAIAAVAAKERHPTRRKYFR